MIRARLSGVIVLICTAVAHTQAPPPTEAPDRVMVRGRVDGLIKSFAGQHKKATLGMIQQAIALSIAYGAPEYNLGDRAGCFRFYAETAASLVAAFPAGQSATDAAGQALADLKLALDHAQGNPDLNHNAWSMRYAFDKIQIAYELRLDSTSAMIRLGNDNYQISQFQEAEDAYETAAKSLGEFDGLPVEQIPFACRYAPLALGNALFAQKKYKQAADAIVAGLHYVPTWPGLTFDLRSLHHDPAEYESLLADLEAKAEANPKDAGAQFLLGYEFYFTGKKKSAREQFEKVIKIDPSHAGARLFLDYKATDRAPGQSPEQPFTPGTGSGRLKA